jgi:hypothetical protein
MKNYIITDQLNPNAVNARYGRSTADLNADIECFQFAAEDDEEALAVFDDAIEQGHAGYSESNTRRVCPKLWRTKAYFNGGKPLFGTIA